MRKKSLGLAFKDEVVKVATGNFSFKKSFDEDWKDALIPNFQAAAPFLEGSNWRLVALAILTLAVFFVLFLRLFHLQIVKGVENRQLADGNRIQVKRIHAQRGVIFDRNGKILTQNAPGFRLIDPKTKKVKIITREQALELEVKNDPEAGNLEVDSVRRYPQGEELSHVIGYVGEISPLQLKDSRYGGYSPGDRVGVSGVESEYEDILRGKDGGEIIEVDAQGRKLRTLRTVPPIAGSNLYLTIDGDLQHQVYLNLKSAAEKVGSCCGAAVVAGANGEILSLISLPSYDNNLFSGSGSTDEILGNKNSPILNRAIGGNYPPGSTFKIISSLAALGSGKIKPDTEFEDTGEISLGTFKFSNWYFTQYGKTEGEVNLVKALKRSTDTYYYRVGQAIGEGTLIDWARKLKLGGKLGIDLPGEVDGLVPDGAWKEKTFGQPWYPGDTLHMAIGQGFVLTSPLQVLSFTSFIGSDGKLYQPHLALRVTTDKGRVIREFGPKVIVSNIISKDDLGKIKEGLSEVPKNGGTAWPFFPFPIATAGKTGTAEFGDPKNKTHAWYTGFAPVDDPKIFATVLVEAGGEGSNVAAPVVKEIFRYFLSPDKKNLIKDIYPIASESAKVLGE